MSRYSNLSDSDLVRLLRRRDKYAFIELGRRYGDDIGARILRINPTWLTQRILGRATGHVLQIVVRTISKQDPDDVDLERVVSDTAKYMGFLLRRSASLENGRESNDDD